MVIIEDFDEVILLVVGVEDSPLLFKRKGISPFFNLINGVGS